MKFEPNKLTQEPEDKVACLEFRDLRGNIIKASDIFPEFQFNKTISAPAGGGRSLNLVYLAEILKALKN